MKNSIVILIAVLFFAACNSNKNSDSVLIAANLAALKSAQKDSVIESYINTFNEIQDNLDSIRNKEKSIKVNSENTENKSVQELINDDLNAINKFMVLNREKMAILNAKLKNSDTTITKAGTLYVGITKMVERVNHDLEMRDMELGDIKDHLGKINGELNNVTANLNEKTKENNKKTNELNTAYYAIGSAKELNKKGIITNEGGFIGLGKSTKIKDDFSKTNFRKININVNTSIAINAKSAKIITTHPANSYKIVGDKKHTEAIEITSPKDFWAASKYLVVLVVE